MVTHTQLSELSLRLPIFILFAATAVCWPQDAGIKATPATGVRIKPPKGRLAYFDSELFEAIASEENEKNVVISPMTVKLLLTMLMEGMDGAARDEIRRTLRLPQGQQAARDIVKTWMAPPQTGTGVTLNLSAGVFVASGNNITKEYAAILREHYSSNATQINVADRESATRSINKWASDATNGLIPALIDSDQISSDTAAVLASAVYFKGAWREPFRTTSVGCFKTSDDNCTDAVFMEKADTFPYAYVRQLDADVLELPYTDERYSMVLMVPRGDVTDLIRDLPHEPMHRILETLGPTQVNVSIPRFTAQYGQDLRRVLTKLKIKKVFSPTLNFKGIQIKNNKTFGIGNVFHATKVIVNEDGSEAAGAAGIEIRPNMQDDNDDVSFKADKPFLFFIRDSITKVTLFAGVINEPEPLISNVLGVSYMKDPATYSPVTVKTDLTQTDSTSNGSNGYTIPPPIYRPTITTAKPQVRKPKKLFVNMRVP